MKQSILYFIAFLLNITNSSAQSDTITDVFDESNLPVWAHVAFDSTAIGIGKRTGTNYYFSLLEDKIIFEKNSAYLVYVNLVDQFSGCFLEKLDLKNGKTIWSNYFDLRNSSKRELSNRFFINTEGELEIIGMRNPSDSVFLFWFNGKLSVRKYDTATGRLVYSHFASELDSTYPKMYCNGTATRLVKNNTKGYDFFENYASKGFFSRKKTKLDSNGKFISEDTVFIATKYINVNSFSDIPGFIDDNPDKQISMKHTFSTYPYLTGDPVDIELDIYNREQMVQHSLNITDQLPKVKNYGIYYLDDKVFIMLSEEGFPNTNVVRQRLHLFDWNGNLLEEVVYQSLSNEPFGKVERVIKLKNEPGMLILNRAPSNSDGIMTFYKTDGKGSMKYIKDIILKEDFISFGRYLGQLNDGNILMSAKYHRKNIPDEHATDRCITSLWSADDLGLVTNTKNEVELKYNISVYPNPSDNILHIQVPDQQVIYLQLFQTNGELVMNKKTNQSEVSNLNITHLQNGLYFLQVLNDQKKLLYSSSFIKQSKLD